MSTATSSPKGVKFFDSVDGECFFTLKRHLDPLSKRVFSLVFYRPFPMTLWYLVKHGHAPIKHTLLFFLFQINRQKLARTIGADGDAVKHLTVAHRLSVVGDDE